MKQNDTKYHQLYLMLNDADDYYPKEDRKELLDLIKELYEENQKLSNNANNKGKYGIKCKTIHDDSSYSDKHEQFFESKKQRDCVYDDWIENRYWNKVLNLNYRGDG